MKLADSLLTYPVIMLDKPEKIRVGARPICKAVSKAKELPNTPAFGEKE